MSYALAFTDRALDDLRGLELWLQEETLDELDELAANPPAVSRRRHLAAVVHDFVRERSGKRYYVFLTLGPDESSKQLRIMELGLYVNKLPS